MELYMKYDKDYRLMSPANRAELNGFNKIIPLIFNIQKHSRRTENVQAL
jgi:hypothetical protein